MGIPGFAHNGFDDDFEKHDPISEDEDEAMVSASERDPRRDMLLVATVFKYPDVVNGVKSKTGWKTTLHGFLASCPEGVNIDRLRCRQSACGGLAIIECLVVFLLRTCVNAMGDYQSKTECLYESEKIVADSTFIPTVLKVHSSYQVHFDIGSQTFIDLCFCLLQLRDKYPQGIAVWFRNRSRRGILIFSTCI